MIFEIWVSTFLLIASRQDGCGSPEDKEWRFVGCVPSPSECYYSCPSLGSYKADVDPEICDDPMAEWACYCPSL